MLPHTPDNLGLFYVDDKNPGLDLPFLASDGLLGSLPKSTGNPNCSLLDVCIAFPYDLIIMLRELRWQTKKKNHLIFKMLLADTCGEGDGTPLQYSCLENPMDGGAWWTAVHGVAKSRTRLSDFTFTFHLHALEKEMATHSSVLAWRIPGTGSLVGCHLWGHTELDTTEAT